MKVYIATIDTNYETIAVGTTEDEARRLAAKKAHQFLTDAGAICADTKTPAKVADFFGIHVTEIEIGTATIRQ